MNTWKIEITEPHSGEIGEAILHEDHAFAMEEYTFEAGKKLDVAVHDLTRDPQVGDRFSTLACAFARRWWWGMLAASRNMSLL